MNGPYQKVIVALDYEDAQLASHLVDQLGDRIEWYKVGPQLFTRSGLEIVQFLHRRSKKIFVDLKLHDTPEVVRETVRQIADLGAHLTTVHCLGGRRMLEASCHSCRGTRLQIIGLTLLTSHESADSANFGWQENGIDIGMRLTQMAAVARLAGVMCSPHDIATIRRAVQPGFLLITPGIRLDGQEVFQEDQNPERTASPKQALEWGADYLVIGRPITQAPQPVRVVENLFGSAPA